MSDYVPSTNHLILLLCKPLVTGFHKCEHNKWEFKQPFFQRGKRMLMVDIVRRKNRPSNAPSQQYEQPNSYGPWSAPHTLTNPESTHSLFLPTTLFDRSCAEGTGQGRVSSNVLSTAQLSQNADPSYLRCYTRTPEEEGMLSSGLTLYLPGGGSSEGGSLLDVLPGSDDAWEAEMEEELFRHDLFQPAADAAAARSPDFAEGPPGRHSRAGEGASVGDTRTLAQIYTELFQPAPVNGGPPHTEVAESVPVMGSNDGEDLSMAGPRLTVDELDLITSDASEDGEEPSAIMPTNPEENNLKRYDQAAGNDRMADLGSLHEIRTAVESSATATEGHRPRPEGPVAMAVSKGSLASLQGRGNDATRVQSLIYIYDEVELQQQEPPQVLLISRQPTHQHRQQPAQMLLPLQVSAAQQQSQQQQKNSGGQWVTSNSPSLGDTDAFSGPWNPTCMVSRTHHASHIKYGTGDGANNSLACKDAARQLDSMQGAAVPPSLRRNNLSRKSKTTAARVPSMEEVDSEDDDVFDEAMDDRAPRGTAKLQGIRNSAGQARLNPATVKLPRVSFGLNAGSKNALGSGGPPKGRGGAVGDTSKPKRKRRQSLKDDDGSGALLHASANVRMKIKKMQSSTAATA